MTSLKSFNEGESPHFCPFPVLVMQYVLLFSTHTTIKNKDFGQDYQRRTQHISGRVLKQFSLQHGLLKSRVATDTETTVGKAGLVSVLHVLPLLQLTTPLRPSIYQSFCWSSISSCRKRTVYPGYPAGLQAFCCFLFGCWSV